jgi:hypothetical protein
LKKRILDVTHRDKGHLTVRAMRFRLRKLFTWSGLDDDCKNSVRNCPDCERARAHQTYFSQADYPRLSISSRSESVWSHVSVDLAGPLTKDKETGARYCVIYICSFSKFVVLSWIKDCRAKTLAFDLFKVCTTFGPMRYLRADNQYNCDVIRRFCDEQQIIPQFITPFSPYSNGCAERAVRSVKDGMRIMSNYEHWVNALPMISRSMNMRPVGPAAASSTAFELFFKRSCADYISRRLSTMDSSEEITAEVARRVEEQILAARDIINDDNDNDEINDASSRRPRRLPSINSFVRIIREQNKKPYLVKAHGSSWLELSDPQNPDHPNFREHIRNVRPCRVPHAFLK